MSWGGPAPAGYQQQPPGGYGGPPGGSSYRPGAPPAGQYGNQPPAQQGGYRPPPPQYGAQQGAYGAPGQPPQQQGGYGAPGQPPQQQGGYGAPGQPPPQQGAYGAPGQPPQQQGGYGARPSYGAPPAQRYGAPPSQGYGAPPAQAGYGAPPGQAGYGAPQRANAPPPYGSHGAAPGGYAPGPPPGISQELWGWFQAVDADRSGKITSEELQRALHNGNWTPFNTETCRLMIGMFDRDRNGTIDIQEFSALWKYIQDWKSCFDKFDADRSGNINANELFNAFRTFGYNLSMNFINVCMRTYDRQQRGAINFDDFIQCCVLLKSLTDQFRAKDTQQNGQIRIQYEEFLKMVLDTA